MKAEEADRLIVEFARLVKAERVLVIGSQTIHAYHPNPPMSVVIESRELDIVPLPYEDFEDLFFYAHEHLGADSEFDVANGIYVDMIKQSVPKFPPDWEDRAIERIIACDDRTVTVVYPEIYDLLVTKLLANRPQDAEFLRGVMQLQPLDRTLLELRLRSVPLSADSEGRRSAALNVVARSFAPKRRRR